MVRHLTIGCGLRLQCAGTWPLEVHCISKAQALDNWRCIAPQMVKALYHCASNGQGTLPLEVHCTCNGQGTLPLEVLCTCNDQGPKDLDHWTLNWFHADYQLKWGTILRRNGNVFFSLFFCYKHVPYFLFNAWMIRCSFFSDARGGCNCQYMFEPADLTVVSIVAWYAFPACLCVRLGLASSMRE